MSRLTTMNADVLRRVTAESRRTATVFRQFGMSSEQVAESIDKWLLRLHGPVDRGDGTRVCASCRGRPVYPCVHAVAVAARIDARRERSAAAEVSPC